eukprot:scaffold1478_cov257-Prasinococcus_capsulatus_cf.AAC.2
MASWPPSQVARAPQRAQRAIGQQRGAQLLRGLLLRNRWRGSADLLVRIRTALAVWPRCGGGLLLLIVVAVVVAADAVEEPQRARVAGRCGGPLAPLHLRVARRLQRRRRARRHLTPRPVRCRRGRRCCADARSDRGAARARAAVAPAARAGAALLYCARAHAHARARRAGLQRRAGATACGDAPPR